MKKTIMLGALSLALSFNCFASSESIQAGQKDYMDYCARCHGLGATGDGPDGLKTRTPPSNLTLLATGNNDSFPYSNVRNILDGRVDKGKDNTAHSRGGMPVWGKVFSEEQGKSAGAQISGEIVAKVRIQNLVDYLASIQK